MLDYSIRGPLAYSISPGFYGWIGRGGSSTKDSFGVHCLQKPYFGLSSCILFVHFDMVVHKQQLCIDLCLTVNLLFSQRHSWM
jgi:hypothetical protein